MKNINLKVSIIGFFLLTFFAYNNVFAQETKTEKDNTENVDTVGIIKNISKEIKAEISYCVVQIAAFANKKTKRQFKKEYDFREYPIKIKFEDNLYKVLIKKKFHNKEGGNMIDRNNLILRKAVRVQMKCKRKFNFGDAFIAAYDKTGKRVALIKDVPKMKYVIF